MTASLRSALTLSTERLELRPLTLLDFDKLYAHWSAPEVGRWLFDAQTPTREQVTDELGQSLELFDTLGLAIWGVYAPLGPLIGTCGFLRIPETGEIELLFSLDPEHWGQGYAHEASLAVLDQAFLTAGLDRVVGRCDVPNLASKRLLERLGMTLDKREPIRGIDCFHFSLEAEDYLLGREDA